MSRSADAPGSTPRFDVDVRAVNAADLAVTAMEVVKGQGRDRRKTTGTRFPWW